MCGGVQKKTTEEQDDGRPRQRVGDRRPADQCGEAAGEAAPDDVLGGAALEQHRVDDEVERLGQQRQPGRQRVDPHHQHHRCQHAEHDAEHRRRERRDDVTRQRPAAGPPHLLVDVAVVDAVERGRRPGRQRAADDRRDDQSEGGTPRAAKNITGTVVSSSSSMTRGLVRPTYAATTSRQVAARPRVEPPSSGRRRSRPSARRGSQGSSGACRWCVSGDVLAGGSGVESRPRHE